MTILELIQATVPYFTKNTVESPRLTIELILAHVLKTTRMSLYLEFDRVLTPSELDELRPIVKKRADGVPLEYALGVASFSGATFKVTSDVLIPRPETEMLLEAVIPQIHPTELPLIDVGTGSGIIAITLARKFPDLEIWACDMSKKALNVAQENGKECPHLHWHLANLLEGIPVTKAQWVLANLPYIPTETISTLSREVRQEPHLALDGGSDGLDLIRQLIPQAYGLQANLALEIWHDQAATLQTLLSEAGYSSIEVKQDLRQMDRFVIAHV
ncbi:MAG: peptide chain release factor N(5)-glutamine methyltransferase [Verrucomicrobiota bacterium]